MPAWAYTFLYNLILYSLQKSLHNGNLFYLHQQHFSEWVHFYCIYTFKCLIATDCTKLNWEILLPNSSTVIADMSKYLTIVCARTHTCEQTHKPRVEHEIAFTCLTILIYLTLRTHKSFMAPIGSDVRIPPVECCAETTEPTHTPQHTASEQSMNFQRLSTAPSGRDTCETNVSL